jgi:hypothetical protein
MSRRTKVILLAIFVVLLGLPTIYVALTWHPPNPLRFRLLAVYPDGTLSGGEKLLRIRIENTSIAPVQFDCAAIDPRSDSLTGGSGSLDPQVQFDGKKLHMLSPPTIPSAGAIELNAILDGDLVDEAEQGSLSIQYHWRSQLLLRENDVRDWFHEHVPFFRHERLKYIPPYDADVTTLDGISN